MSHIILDFRFLTFQHVRSYIHRRIHIAVPKSDYAPKASYNALFEDPSGGSKSHFLYPSTFTIESNAIQSKYYASAVLREVDIFRPRFVTIHDFSETLYLLSPSSDRKSMQRNS